MARTAREPDPGDRTVMLNMPIRERYRNAMKVRAAMNGEKMYEWLDRLLGRELDASDRAAPAMSPSPRRKARNRRRAAVA